MSMLFHHDSRGYDVACKEMHQKVSSKFEATIAQGQIEAQKVLEQLDDEIPDDLVVPSSALNMIPVAEGVEVMVGGNRVLSLHDLAFRQMANAVKLHQGWGSRLRTYAAETELRDDGSNWASDLLADTLTALYHDGPGKGRRFLLRSIQDVTRGWLSENYLRLDCRPLFHVFHQEAIVKAGAVPTRAYSLDTRTAVRAVLPMVFEPVPNMPVLYGAEWHNSNFGHGTHSVRRFVHLPWCTNEATSDMILKQIHRGGRLDENFAYSEKTYQLDQKTAASALRDICKEMFSPEAVNETMATIRYANEQDIDVRQVPKLLGSRLSKPETERVVELFSSTDDHNMPPGATKWRLSNAISFLANNTANRGRALEMERLAGKVGGLAKVGDESI